MNLNMFNAVIRKIKMIYLKNMIQQKKRLLNIKIKKDNGFK